MNSFQENYVSEYFELMEVIESWKMKYKVISNLNISTMTFVCDTGIPIDLVELTTNFQSPSYPSCILKKAKSNKYVSYTKRGKPRKSFYNQTTISYKLYNTVSAKIFTNGKLQLTGLTSLYNCIESIKLICSILKNSNAISHIPSLSSILDISVEMINSNFNIKKEIDLKKLRDILFSNNFKVSYEPDTYPGINSKINNISVFIFGTGNIVITGSKSLKTIENTFTTICSLIFNNPVVFIKNGPGLKKNKRESYYINGYPKHVYENCMFYS